MLIAYSLPFKCIIISVYAVIFYNRIRTIFFSILMNCFDMKLIIIASNLFTSKKMWLYIMDIYLSLDLYGLFLYFNMKILYCTVTHGFIFMFAGSYKYGIGIYTKQRLFFFCFSSNFINFQYKKCN